MVFRSSLLGDSSSNKKEISWVLPYLSSFDSISKLLLDALRREIFKRSNRLNVKAGLIPLLG